MAVFKTKNWPVELPESYQDLGATFKPNEPALAIIPELSGCGLAMPSARGLWFRAIFTWSFSNVDAERCLWRPLPLIGGSYPRTRIQPAGTEWFFEFEGFFGAARTWREVREEWVTDACRWELKLWVECSYERTCFDINDGRAVNGNSPLIFTSRT